VVPVSKDMTKKAVHRGYGKKPARSAQLAFVDARFPFSVLAIFTLGLVDEAMYLRI
jgi:hypothetical protein